MNPQDIIDQLVANSWRAGILIVVLFAVRGFLRRFLDARVIYGFWVLVAVRLLFPFDVPVPASAAPYIPTAPWIDATEFDAVPFVSGAVTVAPGVVDSAEAPSLREIFFNEKSLVVIWLGGMCAVLLAYGLANVSFRRQLSRSSRRADKRTAEMVSDCAQAMGVTPLPALEMDGISGPALFGIWRPRLLFPAGLAEQLSDEELRLVVLHELGHFKRRDLFLQGLLLVSQAVHWFNPLVWLAGRLAREDRELACDEFVMAHTSRSGGEAYAKTLLRVLGLSRPGRAMLPAVGILETKNQLKQRILMIQNYQSTNPRRLVLGAASILAISAGLLMASDSGSKSAAAVAASPETPDAQLNNSSSPDAAIGDPNAKNMIIPKITFTEVSLEEALDFLREKSRELDPEKKGVQIILGDTDKASDTRITMTLENIPLYEAVKYVAAAANLEVSWVGKAIVLSSKSADLSSKGANASAPAHPKAGAPEGWWKNGSKPEAYDVGIDPTQPYKKPVSVYVKSLDPNAAEGNFGGMMQMCRAESFRGKRLKFTGYVKTRDVAGTANLWFRVDGDSGKLLAFDNMQDRPIKGTTDWKEYSVVLDVPEGATALAYGIFISGAGMAWLNDVQLIEVGSNVKSTNLEDATNLPDAPQNLDFSNGK